MALSALRSATVEDLLQSIRDGRACEIVAGELVEKAAGDAGHGDASSEIIARVRLNYNRRPGGSPGSPGGWWIRNEVDVWFGDDVYRPDLSGWRRDRTPVLPDEWPVPVAPDWIAEVLSTSTKKRDLGVKMRAYHHASVGHYWVVDRESQVFYVYRWSPRAYEVALTAFIGDRVRAEPFEAVEIDVGQLFGVEEEESQTP